MPVPSMCIAVAIMWTTGGTPGPAEAESILEAFQNTVLAFCSCCHALTSGAGDSLRKEVRKGVTAAVRPCLGLVKALVRRPSCLA
jgi:hypothetical protein